MASAANQRPSRQNGRTVALLNSRCEKIHALPSDTSERSGLNPVVSRDRKATLTAPVRVSTA